MTIQLKTQKMLWGRAANRCSICRRELVVDATETDDEAIIGDHCHIVGEKRDAARGESELTAEQRDKYANLILLCKVCHKTVDDQSNTYTVEKLKQIKAEHEQWVKESLTTFDSAKQRDDELYASYIEEWEVRANLQNWEDWTYGMVAIDQPRMRTTDYETLQELDRWLFSRVWPGRYIELESAFENFRKILDDLLSTFSDHLDDDNEHHPNSLRTIKFYQQKYHRGEPNYDYDELLKEYRFHVDLVMDLTLELTRAANYVCDYIRKLILPSYRIKEGFLIVMGEGTAWRVQYRNNERTLRPYENLESFKTARFSRDASFSKRAQETDLSD